MSEKNDVPMIPKHQAESEIMHMSYAMKVILTIVVVFCITIAVCVYIFVNGYTSRTKDWLNTFDNLQKHYASVEAENEKEEAGNIQQLQIP